MQQFETFAFNTVRWWRKLGEVENKCTSHIFRSFQSFAIFLPKIIKIGGKLTKFWQKQICLVFLGHGVVGLLTLLIRILFSYCTLLRMTTVHYNHGSFFKSYWDEEMSELKQRSIDTHQLWQVCDRSRSGPIYRERCHARAEYRRAVRWIENGQCSDILWSAWSVID